MKNIRLNPFLIRESIQALTVLADFLDAGLNPFLIRESIQAAAAT